MPKYAMIEPGVDPTDERIGSVRLPVSGKTLVLILSGLGLLVMLLFKSCSGAQSQAPVEPTISPTIAITQTLTSTGTPTSTPTLPQPSATAWLPSYMQTRTAGPAPVVQIKNVEVTKVVTKIVDRAVPVVTIQVITVDVPVQQTVIVTATPGPSSTPGPTNTPYPTSTPAATQTPWIIEITRIVEVTSTPTETPTSTPTTAATEWIPPDPSPEPSPEPTLTPTPGE